MNAWARKIVVKEKLDSKEMLKSVQIYEEWTNSKKLPVY